MSTTHPLSEAPLTLRDLLAKRDLDMATPGRGATAARHLALAGLARRHDVSLARLAEAHVDAVAILDEAGLTPVEGSTYAVWAARAPGGTPVEVDTDRMTANGVKPFCSGLGVVDRALVTSQTQDDRDLLIEVDVSGLETPVPWATAALAKTVTGAATFTSHPVERVVGDDGFYLDRVGFWHGACGPASCWAGAALGLADAAESLTGEDPHRLAHLGAMRAEAWTLQAVLTGAGMQIDADPEDVVAAQYRALALRHTVERTCARLMDHFSRSLGPRPFVSEADVAARYADTHLYLRQSHAERDLQALGVLARPRSTLP